MISWPWSRSAAAILAWTSRPNGPTSAWTKSRPSDAVAMAMRATGAPSGGGGLAQVCGTAGAADDQLQRVDLVDRFELLAADPLEQQFRRPGRHRPDRLGEHGERRVEELRPVRVVDGDDGDVAGDTQAAVPDRLQRA